MLLDNYKRGFLMKEKNISESNIVLFMEMNIGKLTVYKEFEEGLPVYVFKFENDRYAHSVKMYPILGSVLVSLLSKLKGVFGENEK